MAYNPSLYMGGYNPITVPVPQTAPTPNNGLIWVQGDAGAKSYMVAPNSTVLLMNSENDTFFIKSADQSGMPMLRKFSYAEITSNDVSQSEGKDIAYATKDELEALRKELKDLVKGEVNELLV